VQIADATIRNAKTAEVQILVLLEENAQLKANQAMYPR
jgi:hypothetical protein